MKSLVLTDDVMETRQASKPAVHSVAGPGSRITSIDGLRAFAALAVMMFHFQSQAAISFADQGVPHFPLGRYGVQLFFMISGFVILLSVRARSTVRDFAFARFARLYPAYWAAIILSYLVVETTGLMAWRDVGRFYPLVNLTMFQHAFGIIDYLPVAWTLYVELQFYFLLAFLVGIKHVHRLPVVLSMVVVVACVGQAGHLSFWPSLVKWFPLVMHAHLFLFGACVYQLREKFQIELLFCIALCGVNAILVSLEHAAVTGVLAILFLLATRDLIPGLGWKPLVLLGTVSYSLYLTHMIVGNSVLEVLGARHWNWVASLGMAVSLSLLTASLFTFTVELPVNQSLRSWWKRRAEIA